MAQGTEEWFQDRCGRATASCFSDVQAKGEGKVRKKYLLRLVEERLTGKPAAGGFSNAFMEYGIKQEAYARLEYEAATGNMVEEVDFIKHPTLLAGASPDGRIAPNGGLEIKCPIPSVQIETIERGKYPIYHKPQIMGQMWVTGSQWCDFVSYSPTLPGNLRLYIFRVERDEEYIKNFESEVIRFLAEVEEMYQRLIKQAA
jgi:hypothetical protein